MESRANRIMRLGVSGLVAMVLLNAAAYVALAMPAAIPFSRFWWVAWAPAYLVWLVFIVAGLRGRARERDSQR